ncbi:hypothetical protein BABINDRAFT_162560 [Babjeviella inositovora NRRL Y-12698]|uniref:Uncharacterized protein n=1 Tax=Babjeviella inositovora NRRL Y-12698 TaxID=984486 RepID=A0A1E3QN62_9ASCO|nr:uncharacterized protein BABINDRAFT_162560 [Babjeviella inositovora NRRL Y-12698]ODQ78894.1 hypothetical protein BABINDRAFT_162560 [Babjeviella inositovora NRRL Y-12698]
MTAVIPLQFSDLSPISFSHLIFSLQHVWLISHAITLLSVFGYVFVSLDSATHSSTLRSWYLTADLATIITYSVVIYRRHLVTTVRNLGSLSVATPGSTYPPVYRHTRIPLSEVLRSENAHLLAFGLLWLATPQNIIKLLPFACYSFLNLGHFLINECFSYSLLSAAIAPLLAYLEAPLLLGAAHTDIFIILILLKETVQNRSAFALFFYAFIWGLRLESSDASRSSLYSVLWAIDLFFNRRDVPVNVRESWVHVKTGITTLIPLALEETSGLDDGTLLDDDDISLHRLKR